MSDCKKCNTTDKAVVTLAVACGMTALHPSAQAGLMYLGLNNTVANILYVTACISFLIYNWRNWDKR